MASITIANPWGKLEEGSVYRVVAVSLHDIELERLDVVTEDITLGHVVVSAAQQDALVNGIAANLTETEWAVLVALARHRGMVLSHAVLGQMAGLEDAYDVSGNLRVWISRLNKKLGPGIIEVKRGRGYGILV
jgi:DNA-binding response OmpR family regulator